MRNSWQHRAASVLLVVATAWYLPWVLGHLNGRAWWLSIPFSAASLLTALLSLVTVVNHWQRRVPEKRPVEAGQEPLVAVLVPTHGEPPQMVYETARSVLEQDYPLGKMRLVISDDAHRAAIRFLVQRLRREMPAAQVYYHEPYRRGDRRRRGEAKAGNLNSVLDFLDKYAPGVRYVETRDADDKVGDRDFLRQAVGQLVAERPADKPPVAYVQTIKEAMVSPGDPFGNQEPLFYRRAMAARHAANAVFPCGSGLVWRREALEQIGGFPSWNLVEDLQSGVEALRRGWRGVYLPIVGAVGQIAPEDVPNAVKQRGTWALDTMRFSFWGDKRGLNFRQQLQFSELGLFYMLSLAVLVFAVTPAFALAFGVYPLIATHAAYALHFWPYAAALELLMASLGEGLPFESLWRARQTWLGMSPVYAWATVLALIYGPKRKPAYRVTRKEHRVGVYWRETLPQTVLCLALVGASVYHLATHSLLASADLGSLFWAAFFVLGLSRTIRNGWYGVDGNKMQELRGRAVRSVQRRLLPFRTPRPDGGCTVDCGGARTSP